MSLAPGEARSESEGNLYPEHEEIFELVCLRAGVDPMTAKPEDFKRVAGRYSSILQARMASPPAGYVLCEVAKPDVTTHIEMAARRRVLEGPEVDRTKL